ncbi:cyclin-Q [Culicoides brevitarsis]|uniref:cyclin-Q n=1 Tax=Culicoides brevitarsis TaxID=469753 RepID=UPI00307C0CC9
MDIMQSQMMPEKIPVITYVTDYKKSNGKGFAARFLFECAMKLEMKPLTSATAAILFHRFFSEVDPADYDEYMIAASCLYLAGKVKDDPIKIRDVINVAYGTMNRNSAPLELNDEYWTMRDSIVQAELLITRILKFDLSTVHSHKYLLYYMKTLVEWFGQKLWSEFPIPKTSAAFLQDFHHNPAIIDYKPSHVAICCLSLAFQVYGVNVPLTGEVSEDGLWYSVFAKDLTKDLHWEIVQKIMETYDYEKDDSN